MQIVFNIALDVAGNARKNNYYYVIMSLHIILTTSADVHVQNYVPGMSIVSTSIEKKNCASLNYSEQCLDLWDKVRTNFLKDFRMWMKAILIHRVSCEHLFASVQVDVNTLSVSWNNEMMWPEVFNIFDMTLASILSSREG